MTEGRLRDAELLLKIRHDDPNAIVFVARCLDDIERRGAERMRAACKAVAARWIDPEIAELRGDRPHLTGCEIAYIEGQTCTTPTGIAAAIDALDVSAVLAGE